MREAGQRSPAPVCCDERGRREIGRRLHQTLPSILRSRVTEGLRFGNGIATSSEAWDGWIKGTYPLWREGRSAWRGRRDYGESGPARCVPSRKDSGPSTLPRPSCCPVMKSLRRGHAVGDLGAPLRGSRRGGRATRPARDRKSGETAGREAAGRARRDKVRQAGESG